MNKIFTFYLENILKIIGNNNNNTFFYSLFDVNRKNNYDL